MRNVNLWRPPGVNSVNTSPHELVVCEKLATSLLPGPESEIASPNTDILLYCQFKVLQRSIPFHLFPVKYN